MRSSYLLAVFFLAAFFAGVFLAVAFLVAVAAFAVTLLPLDLLAFFFVLLAPVAAFFFVFVPAPKAVDQPSEYFFVEPVLTIVTVPSPNSSIVESRKSPAARFDCRRQLSDRGGRFESRVAKLQLHGLVYVLVTRQCDLLQLLPWSNSHR